MSQQSQNYRDYFAITAICHWPSDFPGPGFVMPDGSRIHSAGFFPLFETRDEAEQAAEAFPGAIVIAVPITVGIIGIGDAK